MNYTEIEVETLSGKSRHITVELANGSFKSFPADESNPEYVKFLEALNNE